MAIYKVYIYKKDKYIIAEIIQKQTIQGENSYRVRMIFKRKIKDDGITLEGDVQQENSTGTKNQVYIDNLESDNRLYKTANYDNKPYNEIVKEVKQNLQDTVNISTLQTAMQSPFHGEWRF